MTFIDSPAGGRHEDTMRVAFVFPKEFYVKYKTLADGSQETQDWVMVAKKGQQNPTETPMRMKDLLRDRDNPVTQAIEPYYKRWKENQTAPVIGTALESWVADAGLVKVLNSVGIRSVEDLAQVEDHLLQKLNLPSVRDKKKRAQAFLEAQKSTAAVSAEVTALREKLAARDRDIAELKALIEQHVIKKAEAVPVKRGPGRPRKTPIDVVP